MSIRIAVTVGSHSMSKNREVKYISVCLRGGIGNQLFQYFAAHDLAMKFSCEVILDDSLILTRKKDESSIHVLNVVGSYKTNKIDGSLNRVYRYTDALQYRSIYLNRVLSHFTQRFVQREVGYSPEIYRCRLNQKLVGYFQTWRHFSHVKDQLPKDIFDPIRPLVKSYILKTGIDLTNDIAVHIRRGDYVALQNSFGLLTPEYYEKALEAQGYDKIKGRIWVFTDATESDVLSILDKNSLDIRIVNSSDSLNDVVQLALMSEFNRIIIANSSYSWWAAKLSNKNARVVAPQNWYKAMPAPVDLIPSEWIQINNQWS